MFGAVEINDPEVGETAIGSDVGGLADVNDMLAVGRDLRVRSNLNAENIHGFQPIGNLLSDAVERGKQKKKDDRARE
jgi:hypothetical protein